MEAAGGGGGGRSSSSTTDFHDFVTNTDRGTNFDQKFKDCSSLEAKERKGKKEQREKKKEKKEKGRIMERKGKEEKRENRKQREGEICQIGVNRSRERKRKGERPGEHGLLGSPYQIQ